MQRKEAAESRVGQAGRARGKRGRDASGTLVKLLDSAERLIATLGVEGATMRQIALDAGQANKNVIQHHFGSKDELVIAVLNRRLEQLAPRRAVLAERLGTEAEIGDLLEVIHLPQAELMERDHSCRYAPFLLQLQLHDGLAQWAEAGTELIGPNNLAYRRLRAILRHLPKAVVEARFQATGAMFLSAVASRAAMRERGVKLMPFKEFIRQLFNAMAGAYKSPP